jgi:hypothetical protein
MLSILCHFHGLTWNGAVRKSRLPKIAVPRHARPGFVWVIEASGVLLCFAGRPRSYVFCTIINQFPGRDQALQTGVAIPCAIHVRGRELVSRGDVVSPCAMKYACAFSYLAPNDIQL